MGSIGTKGLKILQEFCPIDVQKVGIKELVRLVVLFITVVVNSSFNWEKLRVWHCDNAAVELICAMSWHTGPMTIIVQKSIYNNVTFPSLL